MGRRERAEAEVAFLESLCALQSLADVLVKHAGDIVFCRCPNDAFLFAAVFKEDQCRNALDTKLRGDLVVLVHVELSNFCLAVIILGNSLDDRSYHTARSTPCRPEIYQYRNIGTKYFRFEIVIRNLEHITRHEINT